MRPWLVAEAEYARTTLTSAPGAETFLSRVAAEITSREAAQSSASEAVTSAPDMRGGFAYYTMTSADGWAKWCRRRVDEEGVVGGPEHILVDHKQLSSELDGCADVAQLKVSTDGKRAAYSVDSSGAERYTLHVIDLPSESAPSGTRAHRIDEVRCSAVCSLRRLPSP